MNEYFGSSQQLSASVQFPPGLPQGSGDMSQFGLWSSGQEQLAKHIPNWISEWSQVHEPKLGCFYSDLSLSLLNRAIRSGSLQRSDVRKLLKWHQKAIYLISESLPNNQKCRKSQGHSERHDYKGRMK